LIVSPVEFRSRRLPDGSGERLSVLNLAWCGSARCPRCAGHVASKLSERVAAVLAASRHAGFGAGFLTFTVSHGPGVSLLVLREVLAATWRALQRGGLWRRLKREGLLGIIRTWEVTWGSGSGWHPHAHGLVLHRDGPEAAVAAGRALMGRWLALLGGAGWYASPLGQDVRPVTDGAGLGDYGVKSLRGWGAAAEMARGWQKDGRRPDRLSLPQLLALAVAGDPVAAARYAEAVEALKGQRLLVVGPSIKEALGMVGVQDVPDLVDGEALDLVEDDGELVGTLDGLAWATACDRRMSAWVVREIKARWRSVPWAVLRRDLRGAILHGPEPPDG
jgi:hypothetical protein